MPIRGGAGGDFLTPPGPSPWEYVAGTTNYTFDVQLGNVMIIHNLIPTTIQWEFENRFDAGGYPVAALMKLNFISYSIPAQAEIMGYFTL